MPAVLIASAVGEAMLDEQTVTIRVTFAVAVRVMMLVVVLAPNILVVEAVFKYRLSYKGVQDASIIKSRKGKVSY